MLYRLVGKRSLDVLLSLIGLCVLIPVLLVIAVLIKLENKGSVIFKQKRLGKDRRIFTIYKFRTMVPNEHEASGSTLYEADPRITKVGKWLRRLSLDELPQLVNILKGDMAVIGPRPILPVEFVSFEGNALYARRFSMLPGLFCTVDLDYRAKASRELQFQMDVEYGERMSLENDTKLFLKIVKTVIMGANVYKA